MYSTIAPMIGLPLSRQAQRIRAKDQFCNTYMPGLNDWALTIAASREVRPLQMSMDGTRVVRTVELYLDTYLLGQAFPADVRMFPSEANLIKANNWEQVQQYVLSVRANKQYAAEAYSFDLIDTSGKLPDIMVGSIPEATSGVTASHILALMLEIEEKARKHNVPLIGHCTDSASNVLNALIKLASPGTYACENVHFLGLRRAGFTFFAPFLKDEYPSIAIPCWDHSSRTSLRNLMNTKLTLTVGHNNTDCGIQNAIVATIQDLHLLKKGNPQYPVKYGDITPFMRQNCDATSRALTQDVVEALASTVPGSQATQLYIQASVHALFMIHAPFRNEKFGPPTSVACSLWAGVMTWRRWRQYVIISPNLSLSQNFISRGHYVTLELLAHAGINYMLCLYYSFPNLSISEYSLRHTGNRSIEAIHGAFRGGTSSLPITSPNLSFREFLMQMNKAQQIQSTEHRLKRIEGNSIVASKKKRRTFALSGNEQSSGVVTDLPETYDLMMKELNDACDKGDSDSKSLLEKLTPAMVEVLKSAKKWDYPDIPFENFPTDNVIVDARRNFEIPTEHIFTKLTEAELGPVQDIPEELPRPDSDLQDESCQALANLLMDTPFISQQGTSLSIPSTSKGMLTSPSGVSVKVTSILKSLQPQREKPSKDRSRRFAAGDLCTDVCVSSDDEVQEFQYWTIYPEKRALQNARVFLLGRIILILKDKKPTRSAEKCCSHCLQIRPSFVPV